MAGFRKHSGKIAVYSADDVDTDRIIPARFLSMVTKSGYGDLLFRDVRGEDFPLDQPEAADASVLLVGRNFGCGSSREHAVWALQQAGFQVIIARREGDKPGFSDIFRQNAANCGLLLIELPAEEHRTLSAVRSGAAATIDLENQLIETETARIAFEITPSLKIQHLEGLDLIGTTLRQEEAISQYEKANGPYVPGT